MSWVSDISSEASGLGKALGDLVSGTYGAWVKARNGSSGETLGTGTSTASTASGASTFSNSTVSIGVVVIVLVVIVLIIFATRK